VQDVVKDTFTVVVPNIAVAGTLDSVTVFYSGTPPAPATSIPSGYNFVTKNSTQKALFTLGEAFTGHTWWPCKESLYDKIDSVDLIVTAPNTYKVAANGLVTEVASGSNTITTWKTRYAIATYGINFAIANFQNYQYNMTTGGKTLSVMNYLYAEDNTATYQNSVNGVQTILPMFVSVFGVDYPFLDEKYGTTECTGNWGALEVQNMTFVAKSSYNASTLAHELAHQWFGDMLTTNTWHNIWLNEGFAQYCESVIYPENMLSAATAATKRQSLKAAVTTTSTTYVTDTSTADAIFFDGSTTAAQPYNKGAMILSMLRAWLGDTKFFQALKNYLNAPGLKYGFTSVDSLQKYMEATTPGLNLTNFFNDWVMKKGYAKYVISYAPVNKGIVIQLTQSPTSSGQGYFDMPVPIRITNGSGLDTTVIILDKRGVLYNNITGATTGTNKISFLLSQTPSSISLDPNNVVLASATSIGVNAILPIHEIVLKAAKSATLANLNWKIAADESLEKVVLEKSADGIHFTELKVWNELVRQDQWYTGTYSDDLRNAIQYYRISAFDKDGSHLYSNIEKVTAVEAVRLQVKPNPATDKITVTIPASFQDGQLKVIIQNVAGQVVRELEWKNRNVLQIDLSTRDLSGGLYNLLLINSNGEQVQTKFIRQ
jgi:aminopeptidase N